MTGSRAGRVSDSAITRVATATRTMLVPVLLLAVGAVFAGWMYSHEFLDSAEFWGASIAYDEHFMHSLHMLTSLPTGSMVPHRAHSLFVCTCVMQYNTANDAI